MSDTKIHCVWIDPETKQQCPNDASVAVQWGRSLTDGGPTNQLEACNQQHAEEIAPTGDDTVKYEELKR